MFFFTPRQIKVARQYVKDARKLVAYKRDLAPEQTIADVEREIVHLEALIKQRNEKAIAEQMQRLDNICGQLSPPTTDAVWRENVEVFLVAIVIALAVRTYFLQPFTIPTGSMQPTLNGIIGHPTEEPAPNAIVQALHMAVFGRNYLDVVAQEDEEIISISEEQRAGLRRILTYTRIHTSANDYWVWAPVDTIRRYFRLPQMARKGEPILRGYIDTGDHVFVDKFTYNFRRPQRGEVFVFSTHGIPKLNSGDTPSQFYIKRLAGVPNDILRIDPPNLYVNGELAKEYGFVRNMKGTLRDPYTGEHGEIGNKDEPGYRGYGNGALVNPDTFEVRPMVYLTSPTDEVKVEPDHYFALGDNSYNSADSRDWGQVPKQNVMGRAVFVYWPFTSHWSLIR